MDSITKKISNKFFEMQKIDGLKLNTKEMLVYLNLYVRGNTFKDQNGVELTKTYSSIDQILKTNINKYNSNSKEAKRSIKKILKNLDEKGYFYEINEELKYTKTIIFLTSNEYGNYTKLNVEIYKNTKELELNHNEVMIYTILKYFSYNKEYTNVSINTIKEYLNISRQTIINNIKSLEKKDIIRIDRAINKTNIYYLKNKQGIYFIDKYVQEKLKIDTFERFII